MSTTLYGEEITGEDLVSYPDEISNEEIIPLEDLPEASYPLKLSIQDKFYDDDGLIDSGFPSNIPIKIDKLKQLHETPLTISEAIEPIILLKNTLNSDVIIKDSFNGVCVELDTTGFNMKIDHGSCVAAL